MHSIAWWPTLIAVAIATVWDIRERRIPNWLVVPFLLAGLVIAVVRGGWSGLGESVLGISLGGLLMGALYWLGGTGMGDVKLCMAIGAWIGPRQLGIALVVMGITGGVMAMLWAARGGYLRESLDGAGDLITGLGKRGFQPHPTLRLANPAARKMPYAPAIAIGTLFSFLAIQ